MSTSGPFMSSMWDSKAGKHRSLKRGARSYSSLRS